MRIFMLAFVGSFALVCAAADAVAARDDSLETALRKEYEIKKEKIQQLFNDKIEKIGERSAIPEDLRQMLIQQADEVKEFDIKTLDLKLDLKLKHARQRSMIKDRLKEDAMSRAQWILDNEREFEEKKKQRAALARTVQEDAKAPQKAGEMKSEANERPKTETADKPVAPMPEKADSAGAEPKVETPVPAKEPVNAAPVSSAAEEAKAEEGQAPAGSAAAKEKTAEPAEMNISDQELAEIEAVERGFLDELKYSGANEEEINRAFLESSSRIQEMKNSGATKEEIVKALEMNRERTVEMIKARLSEENGG